MRRLGPRCAAWLRPLRRSSAAAAADVTELYVRNLPRSVTTDDVYHAFSAKTEVSNVRLARNRRSSNSRPFAFVTVAGAAHLWHKKALSEFRCGDYELLVQVAQNPTKDPVHKEHPRTIEVRVDPAWQAMQLNVELVSAKTAADVLALFETRGADFDAANLAQALFKLGGVGRTLEATTVPLVHKLVQRATSSILDDFGRCWMPRDVGNACWGIASLRHGVEAPAFFEAVSLDAPQRIGDFDARSLSNLVWAYATLGLSANALFGSVAEAGLHKVAAFDAKALSDAVWAFATARVRAPSFLAAAADEAAKKPETFDAQALANTVWAYATLEFDAPALFKAAAAEAPKKIWTFNAQSLSRTAWAFATAGVSAPALFEAVAAEGARRVDEFRPSELAEITWAFARADAYAENAQLFKAVALEAPKKMVALDAEALSRLVWAFAKTGARAPNLFESAAAAARKKLLVFTPRQMSDAVWAYATAEVRVPALFAGVVVEARRKMAAFEPRDLANTAWAFAAAGFDAPELFEAVAGESRKKLETFGAQDLAATAWAFAEARISAPQLFDAVAEVALGKMDSFDGEAVSRIVWAYARARVSGARADALFEAAAAAVLSEASFHADDVARVAWAFAAYSETASATDLALFDAAALRLDARMHECGADASAQLHQVSVHLEQEAPGHVLTLLLGRHAAALRPAAPGAPPAAARYVASLPGVAAALGRIGFRHDAGHVTAEGLCVFADAPADKVALELYSPRCYLTGLDGAALRVFDGDADLRRRALRRAGWTVVGVPFYEWDVLRSNEEQDAYLRGGLGLAYGGAETDTEAPFALAS